MTGDGFKTELENIVSNLNNSGFSTIDSGLIEKLDKIAVSAGDLGMKEGKHLIENLSGVMKAIQEGKSKPESGSIRLTALDFYLKNLSGNESIEDL